MIIYDRSSKYPMKAIYRNLFLGILVANIICFWGSSESRVTFPWLNIFCSILSIVIILTGKLPVLKVEFLIEEKLVVLYRKNLVGKEKTTKISIENFKYRVNTTYGNKFIKTEHVFMIKKY